MLVGNEYSREVIDIIKPLLNHPELGVSSVFLGLLLLMIYFSRKDNREHRSEFREVNKSLLEVVKENTKSKVELNDTIKELRNDLRNK